MKIHLVGNNPLIANIISNDVLILDTQSALDLMMSVRYEKDVDRIILEKKNLCDEFFDLKTKLAGEVLQKFINYQMKIAIIGDFSLYQSKALHDFIYECNNGKDIFFMESLEQAIDKLSNV